MTDTDTDPTTANAAVDQLVSDSRRSTDFPVRTSFLQSPGRTGGGPLSSLVSARDKRALLLYLLTITKASKEPWEVTLPSVAWARILDLPAPESGSARTAISRAWKRLETLHLIERSAPAHRNSPVLLGESPHPVGG